VIPEPQSRSGCATCTTARCCVVFNPELTGFDLLRLAEAQERAPRDFAAFRPVRTDEAGADGIRLLGDARTWVLCLRPRGDAPSEPGGRPCVFLQTRAPGVRRCGVYPARPMRCRAFPTELTPAGVMVDTPEAICPPGAWTPARTDLPRTRLLHLRDAIERDLHRAFVARWNHRAGGETSRSAAEQRFLAAARGCFRALEAVMAPAWGEPSALDRLGSAWIAATRGGPSPREGAPGAWEDDAAAPLAPWRHVVLAARALLDGHLRPGPRGLS